MYGGQATSGFTNSVVALGVLMRQNGINFQWDFMSNESLIQRARNYLTDNFMRSGFTHMMFVDADIEFNPHDVMSMLAISDYHSEYDILCGPYPKKMIAWEKIFRAVKNEHVKEAKDAEQLSKYVGDFVFNFRPNEKGEVIINTGRPTLAYEGGTGFMMIQRRALEKFADLYPDAYYRPDHKRSEHFKGDRKIMAYFECPIDRGISEYDLWKIIRKAAAGEKVTGDAKKALEAYSKASLRLLSEDYTFCRYAGEIGLKLWLCPWIKLTHYGTYPFQGDLDAIMSTGSSPTAGNHDVQRLPPKVKPIDLSALK